MPSLLSWSLGALTVFYQSALANDEITSDSHFYGQSPPVYPAPSISPAGAWSNAVAKAIDLVNQMTLEEKVNFTSGVTSNTGCSGMIPALTRLNFTGLCLSDAGNGVRATDFVSAWPSGLHVGASWNKDLTHLRAHYMGREAKIKGVNALLGPCIGPVGRVVEGGRNWESFSVDPYLSGMLVHKTVEGIQGAGVIATTKHFIGNEQETSRVPHGDQEAVSSNIDDRTMHELYLWPFQDAVHAGTGSIMCSYNRLNNSHACQNSKTQNGLLKGELGFQGYIVSDWTAQQSGVASALAGLDMAMPDGAGKWEGNLTIAINNGSVPESRLNDMVTRILAPWFLMSQDRDFPSPGVGMPADINAPHVIVDARTKASKSVLFDGAAEGHVLVKNTNNSLPLDSASMKLISIFGYSAKATDVNNPGKPATGEFFAPWTAGMQPATNKTLENKSFLGGFGFTFNPTAKAGTMISGGGSGATADSWYSAPYDALVSQAGEDGTILYWDFESGNPDVHPESNACLVFGNVWSTEGHDRPSLRDDFTDGLVLNVAERCSNTIVILHNAGTRLVDQFADHPNVTAIVFAHLPGEQSGNALVSILYGKVNPSGRLPYTVAKNETDYGSLLEPELQYPDNTTFSLFPQSNFTEGVYLDYRHFDSQNIAPRYEFGFGLSYTTFEYRNLAISKASSANWQAYPQKNVSEGGQLDLWDELVEVSASITNSGSMDGKEVAQLYLGIPGQNTPTKQLRGFEKPFVGAGETVTVKFALTRRDLSIWDVSAQKWLLQQGQYGVYVGSSSRNLPLTASFSI